MMVETILESSQDFGMSNGSLPQWKRELLQRRAARSRAAAPPAAPPPPPPLPPPPPDDEDEELRYGPGIVKRLKSRYLSLALRDAPRRRPSVLRRAASLEHLLDERAPPTPAPRPAPGARPPRPASVAAPPAPRSFATRRDSVKRARSVDALSRLDRDEPPPPSPSPPPPPLAPPTPRPPQPRTARPPRRPTPLLRDTERPPPDLVKSTLRKFESAPTRRPQPAARVSAVLRGLEPPPRTSTPEPNPLIMESPTRSPSPPPLEISIPDEAENGIPMTGARLVSRAALEGIAKAGSSTRYSFEAPRAGSHLPPLAATNMVLVGRARRVGVIRPMPAPTLCSENSPPSPVPVEDPAPKIEEAKRVISPIPAESDSQVIARVEKKDPPPSALVEPIPRVVSESVRAESPPRDELVAPVAPAAPASHAAPLVNGHATEQKSNLASRIGAAGIERPWSGSGEKKPAENVEPAGVGAAAGVRWGGVRRARAPPPAATSVVFNFSDRKEVPDYIENDGLILRNKKNRIKPGEPGVVVLRPEALARDSGSEDEADCGPPSPCGVRFVNDNVLINGRSSMPARPNRDRIAKLKLQFDDSLTRTFEYPSETSLCEDSPTAPSSAPSTVPSPAPAAVPSPAAVTTPAPTLADTPLLAPLAANTHIASAALSRYTPSKTRAAAFQLGVTRADARDGADADVGGADKSPSEASNESERPSADVEGADVGGAGGAEDGGDARPCAAHAARSWSQARTHHTDLLF